MAMGLRLELRLSQKLIMTPQLQQAIKLLQLSRLELQQTLTQHLMENPLLEELQEEVEDQEGAEQGSEDQKNNPEASLKSESPGSEPTPAEGSPEDLSPTSWDEYFDGDRRVGDTEYPGGQQEEFPSYEQTMVKPTSLEDHLLWQLGLADFSNEEKGLARMIIGNLEEDGYFRLPLEEFSADAGISVQEAESILKLVQTFDPIGVAARDLSECLLIQLGLLDKSPLGGSTKRVRRLRGSLVETIVINHLKDLEKRNYARIAKTCDATLEEVVRAARIIEVLEPKPGRPYFSDDNHVIIPDVFVSKHEGEWEVQLNDDGLPRMRIAPYYKQMMAKDKLRSSETKSYLDEKFRAAQWVIKSIEQRNKTIIKVVVSIVKFQGAFFEKGVTYLKPLVLKQVAEDIGMHESTISRVTANKYLYCPQGMLELKFFFNTGIQRSDREEEMLSSVTVKEMIRKMVAEEDARCPLKDDAIAARLKSRQVIIARRTVAKYRSEENIPSANQRKRFF